MINRLRMLFSAIAFVLLLTTFAFGQETSGEIQGTIRDPQGAVVPNVTITVTGVDVGFNRTIQTDAEGFFRVRQIPPGIYNVSTRRIRLYRTNQEGVQIVPVRRRPLTSI